MGVIAFDWAFRMKENYNADTYQIFYGWLKKYVRGWGDCDDFCTHAFGELLRQDKSLFEKVREWTNDTDFWVRRASAVILIPAILHNDYEGLKPLEIADRLISDEHDLVQKGYGWMLKSLSQTDRSAVESTTEEIPDDEYEIKKSVTLKAGKTSTVTIICGEKKCKLKVKCTTKKHRKGKKIEKRAAGHTVSVRKIIRKERHMQGAHAFCFWLNIQYFRNVREVDIQIIINTGFD